ncbi:SDR family NAD(P)-dependent oxidoreductase [Blastococcus sp. URHD0036]|uniref:SDR family NAD(P)-dependent oxidoreductase n=1 Tax=Blastococcus sp. URHD0036 TaxID=1380356 RepID=UPI000497073A|nr:SDR family NAD(P)-dependent oxidoreductase [Blastococcus sp. URHD0036]
MNIEEGQVAVVTGAASGIGLALSRALGRLGVIVVMADVEAGTLIAAAKTLDGEGIRTRPVVTDVSSWPSVQHLAEVVTMEVGPVDLLCNNAGVVGPWAPTWEQDLANWRWVLGVNLDGVVHGLRAFLPRMVARGAGQVVNVASRGGVTPLPGNAVYAASKHAVVGLTESLREELGRIGSAVGVTLVLPGLVATNISESDRNRPKGLRVAAPPASDGWRPSRGSPSIDANAVARSILEAVQNDLPVIAPAADVMGTPAGGAR